MLFGQLSTKELKKLTFRLPPDQKGNQAVLATSKSSKPKVYIGCAKWGRREWLGKIYPPRTKESEFLQHYVYHYNSIELNATHYKIYDPDSIEKWNEKARSRDFKFCPKAHRAMSFLKHSPVQERVTEEFIAGIRAFGKHLGPVFITHDEKIKLTEEGLSEFFTYLKKLPRDITFFVEERASSFFADKKLRESYYKRLEELGIGAVITDTAGRQDALHMRLTIPKAFVRFVGNSLHPTDFPRIDHWATRFKKWLDADIEEIYFFMHMHDEGLSPELTQYVVERFNKKCGLKLPPVKFEPEYRNNNNTRR